MEKKTIVSVSADPLSIDVLTSQVASEQCGAIATFLGTTRDHFNGKKVLQLDYEGYVPMAEKKLLEICEEARQRWDVMHISVHHRIGTVPLGESSVEIAVSSVHRREALKAVEFCIDEIKSRVPIWKKEVYEDGSTWKENTEWLASGVRTACSCGHKS
eukprot:GILJ01011660.1.p1 GENE.GILJ01011660.1~~GILJ01011660.1.p1  ORF type:complete len:158 (+),score=12.13 GILJ01011660.1:33-506(+)